MATTRKAYSITAILFSLIFISCGGGNPTTEPVTNVDTKENQPKASPTPSSPVLPKKAKDTTIQEVDFKPSNSNQELPENILLEISYFPGGGGAICAYTEVPILSDNHVEAELLILDFITVCGWKSNEQIILTTEYPDGSITTQQLIANEADGDVYYTRLNLKFGLEDKPGLYRYTFTGQGAKFEATANFHLPQRASLLRVNDSQLLMYGFRSNESVALYYYYKESFKGWKTYTVDRNGLLLVNVPSDIENKAIHSKNQYFVAVGKTSGEVPLIFETVLGPRKIVNQDSIIWSCGNLRPRLAVYLGAQVAFTDGSNMRIRKNPGLASEIIDTVPEGTKFTVIDGPVCENDISWWKVSGSFEKGWMAEHNNEIYWLEPTP